MNNENGYTPTDTLDRDNPPSSTNYISTFTFNLSNSEITLFLGKIYRLELTNKISVDEERYCLFIFSTDAKHFEIHNTKEALEDLRKNILQRIDRLYLRNTNDKYR